MEFLNHFVTKMQIKQREFSFNRYHFEHSMNEFGLRETYFPSQLYSFLAVQ